MKRVIVRYKVKSDRVEENERLVRAVYAQLERECPDGIRYATLKLDDGVSFMHIATIDTADGKNPLLALSAFAEFSASIDDRCEEKPKSGSWTRVGGYRFFADDPTDAGRG